MTRRRNRPAKPAPSNLLTRDQAAEKLRVFEDVEVTGQPFTAADAVDDLRKWCGLPPASAETTTPPPDDGLYWESKVAESLGLSRERIRTLRQEHLTEGVDFRTVRGEVVLTELGLTKITAIDDGKGPPTPAAPDDSSAKFPVPKGPPARAKFTVVRIPANKRLLYCVPKGEHGKAPQVLIRVKDNSFFMPWMELEAIESDNNSWQFRGRLPRKKGKW